MSICSGCIIAFTHWLASGLSRGECDSCKKDFSSLGVMFSQASSIRYGTESESHSGTSITKDSDSGAKTCIGQTTIYTKELCDVTVNHQSSMDSPAQRIVNKMETCSRVLSKTSSPRCVEESLETAFSTSNGRQCTDPHSDGDMHSSAAVVGANHNVRETSLSETVVHHESPVTPINRCADSQSYLESIKSSIRKGDTVCYTPFPRFSEILDRQFCAETAVESPAWLTRLPLRLPPLHIRVENQDGTISPSRATPSVSTPLRPRKVSIKRLVSDDCGSLSGEPVQKLRKISHLTCLSPQKKQHKTPSPPHSPPRNSLIYSSQKGLARRKLLGVTKKDPLP